MLILTRRIGQVVVIGSDITLTILSIKGNQAHIGISAPKTTVVNRQEVHDRLEREGDADGNVRAPPLLLRRKP